MLGQLRNLANSKERLTIHRPHSINTFLTKLIKHQLHDIPETYNDLRYECIAQRDINSFKKNLYMYQ